VAAYCDQPTVLTGSDWRSKSAGTQHGADDLLEIDGMASITTRVSIAPGPYAAAQAQLEQHLKQRYGEYSELSFDVLLYDLPAPNVEERQKEPIWPGITRHHRPDCEQMVIALI